MSLLVLVITSFFSLSVSHLSHRVQCPLFIIVTGLTHNLYEGLNMRGAAGMSLLLLVITCHSLCISHLSHRVQWPFYYIIESYPQLV